eukprot:CAMPEP_0178417996 /NCGR_PEP_ID=MMETSP0689_2-20121128/24860_1 /TAXON_ID=160604 /ORGANISM="Amphidinium massartii, Strain CS-259" /LENGTH=150 /DNA_ID=CAMNT_0020039375 /DNA_START=310 /DNA_END=762 /DNA_ORIENTATION=-
MSLSCLHCEGRRNKQDFRSVQEGQLLVELREANVVAHSDAKRAYGACTGCKHLARQSLAGLHQPRHRHIEQVDLSVRRFYLPLCADDEVSVVDSTFLVICRPFFLEASERQPDAVLCGQGAISLHRWPRKLLSVALGLTWPGTYEGEALR